MKNTFTIDGNLDNYIKGMLDSWKLSRKEFDEWFNFIESKKDKNNYIGGIKTFQEVRTKLFEILNKRPE